MHASLRVALPALFLSLIATRARAQTTEEPTPTTEPGAAAVPPESPVEVPPPSSTKISEGVGTSSVGTIVDEGFGRARKPPRYVAYEAGRLVVRDPSGILELSPQGLLQFDTYGYFGPGVKDYMRPNGTGLKSGLQGRRVRVELSGRVSGRWYFLFGAQAGGEGAASLAPLNNFVGVDLSAMLKLQVGQFRVPFTMDNVGGIRFGEFMERTLTARVMGAPLVRDLGVMAWGGTDRSAIWWALGYFGGEGGNRPSTDNRGDVVGRLVFRPLWSKGSYIGQAHIGVSGRYGRRDRNYVTYAAPSMTTQGGYEFWSQGHGTGDGSTRILPSNDQSAVAAEVFIPFCCIDFRGEVVLVRDGRREVLDSSLNVPTTSPQWNNTERAGTLSGYSWYVQATWWPFGPTRMVGAPGNWSAPTEDHSRARALAVAVRYEQLRAKYDSIDRSNDDAGNLIGGVRRGELDAATTNIHVNAVQLAATYWATRHVRLTAQWSLYSFPGVPNVANQATAPGSKPNAPSDERADARALHEISARLQVSF